MRRKALRPVDLPLGVVAIDGKSVWTGDEKVNDFCQRSHKEGGMPYWHFRVLRAALVSAAAPVCIDQAPIPAETNDMGAFPDFFSALRREYSRSQLFEVVTMDAGFCSEQNARLVDEAGYGYVIGLKGNQPELLTEARRVLLPLAEETPPEAPPHTPDIPLAAESRSFKAPCYRYAPSTPQQRIWAGIHREAVARSGGLRAGDLRRRAPPCRGIDDRRAPSRSARAGPEAPTATRAPEPAPRPAEAGRCTLEYGRRGEWRGLVTPPLRAQGASKLAHSQGALRALATAPKTFSPRSRIFSARTGQGWGQGARD